MTKPTESYMKIRRKPLGMKVLFITKIFLTHELCQHIGMPREHLLIRRGYAPEYIVSKTPLMFDSKTHGERCKGGYVWKIYQSFPPCDVPEMFQDIGEDWKYFNITTSYDFESGRCTIRKWREIQ